MRPSFVRVVVEVIWNRQTVGLAPRLQEFVSTEELARLQKEADAELAEPGRWGTTLTVIQSWGRWVN